MDVLTALWLFLSENSTIDPFKYQILANKSRTIICLHSNAFTYFYTTHQNWRNSNNSPNNAVKSADSTYEIQIIQQLGIQRQILERFDKTNTTKFVRILWIKIKELWGSKELRIRPIINFLWNMFDYKRKNWQALSFLEFVWLPFIFVNILIQILLLISMVMLWNKLEMNGTKNLIYV